MAEKEEGKVAAEGGAEAEADEEVEVKFRLFDGSDIGPLRCNAVATTVAALKDRVVADWPKDKTIVPKTANDVKLISGGKILENDKNIAQCRAPFGDLPSTAITMHVVVQPSSAKSKPGELYYFIESMLDCLT
ncbi:Os04g0393300 [Oryza sativa Japonica Group]|uniref:Os04g0393300 protein n=1 Tax=Oryza sativa subsp. japonica TaxID=39947 RepID=B7E6A7_ORYSJ|nr:hypothetical protein DAI22_04g109100 [Oryza sativa Japonica Group]BAG87904.1 unnamed protein product [Oryza sativa Japonica Group]BAS88984.1 Os04g0393300 [Oryza sativa Japonica Group]